MKRHLTIVILSSVLALGGALTGLVSSHAQLASNTGPQMHVAYTPGPHTTYGSTFS